MKMEIKEWCKLDPEWLKVNLERKDEDKNIEAYLFYLKRLCFRVQFMNQCEAVRPLTQSDELKVINKLVTNIKYDNIIKIICEIASKHNNKEVIKHFNWLKGKTLLGEEYGC